MEPTPATAPAVTRGRRGLRLLLVATTALVLLLDQTTKYLVVARLQENVPVTLISGWLELRLIRNPGAAFSLSTGTTWIFTIIAIVVSVVILRISRRLGSRGWALALGLLLGGAVGNLIDRLFRAPGVGRGHVVDFIHYLKFPFMDFPIFNVADSCIVTAAFLIALLGFFNITVDGTRLSHAAVPADVSDTPRADG